MTERRKRLEKLVPQLFNRKRNLHNLPKIRRKRAASQTFHSDVIQEMVSDNNEIIDALPTKRFKGVQSDIRNFFFK